MATSSSLGISLSENPDGETGVINPSGPQSCITSLTWGIAQCRLCNSSFPTNPGNLSQMEQHWIPPQRWSWITQWLAKTTLAGSSPKKGIRNWQLTQQGQTQPHVRVPLSPGLSQKPGSSSHVQGQQGLGLFIVSVTSRSFLHLFS